MPQIDRLLRWMSKSGKWSMTKQSFFFFNWHLEVIGTDFIIYINRQTLDNIIFRKSEFTIVAPCGLCNKVPYTPSTTWSFTFDVQIINLISGTVSHATHGLVCLWNEEIAIPPLYQPPTFHCCSTLTRPPYFGVVPYHPRTHHMHKFVLEYSLACLWAPVIASLPSSTNLLTVFYSSVIILFGM